MSRLRLALPLALLGLAACPSQHLASGQYSGVIILDASSTAPKGYYKGFSYLRTRYRLTRCIGSLGLRIAAQISDDERIVLSTACATQGTSAFYYKVDIQGSPCRVANTGNHPCRIRSVTEQIPCSNPVSTAPDLTLPLSRGMDAIVSDEERQALAAWAQSVQDISMLTTIGIVAPLDDTALCTLPNANVAHSTYSS